MNFFLEELNIDLSEVVIKDDQVHHFKNVARGKSGDTVKVFNGKGLVSFGQVSGVSKKELTIEVTRSLEEKPKRAMSLILGVPKREYLESILRSAVQLGLSEVLLLHTKFTPQKFKPTPRLEKILTSSVIQSENPWLPQVRVLKDWEEALNLPGLKLSFATEVESLSPHKEKKDFRYFIIGPEGGFHKDEIELMKNNVSVTLSKCPTAIMKAETAVPYAVGVLDSFCAMPQNQ